MLSFYISNLMPKKKQNHKRKHRKNQRVIAEGLIKIQTENRKEHSARSAARTKKTGKRVKSAGQPGTKVLIEEHVKKSRNRNGGHKQHRFEKASQHLAAGELIVFANQVFQVFHRSFPESVSIYAKSTWLSRYILPYRLTNTTLARKMV